MKKIMIFILIAFYSIVSTNQSQTSGWIPQVVSGSGNGNLRYIQFLNNQTGWVSSIKSLLKTTNGGQNWNILVNNFYNQNGFSFVNEYIGWRSDYTFNHSPYGTIYKTIDGGVSWNAQLNGNDSYSDLYFYSETLGYASSYYVTTNGGANWGGYPYNGNNGVWQKIFISNSCGYSVNDKIFRTTNSGTNWTVLYDNLDGYYNFYSVYFVDSLNGYVSGKINSSNYGIILKTINGGGDWNVVIPNSDALKRIVFVNYYSGYAITNNKIYKTSNSGLNWSQQLCDSTLYFNCIVFSDSLHGWIACNNAIILKTTNGGSVFTNNISSEVPEKYQLFQNYPNPFNPTTNIKYQIVNNNLVTIKIFDVDGKEIATLVNERQSPGTYGVRFDGSNIPSGVYFYKLTVGNYTETKKMILVK